MRFSTEMYKLLYLEVIFKVSNKQLVGTNPSEQTDADSYTSPGTQPHPLVRNWKIRECIMKHRFLKKVWRIFILVVSLAYLSPSCYFLQHPSFLSQKSNPTSAKQTTAF